MFTFVIWCIGLWILWALLAVIWEVISETGRLIGDIGDGCLTVSPPDNQGKQRDPERGWGEKLDCE